MIKKDDYVTRKSYDNDIVFKVLFIMNNIAYLQGVDIRLIADSYIDDLIKVEQIRNNDEVESLPIQKGNYLNGKILHCYLFSYRRFHFGLKHHSLYYEYIFL